jgi:hypothetical protein
MRLSIVGAAGGCASTRAPRRRRAAPASASRPSAAAAARAGGGARPRTRSARAQSDRGGECVARGHPRTQARFRNRYSATSGRGLRSSGRCGANSASSRSSVCGRIGGAGRRETRGEAGRGRTGLAGRSVGLVRRGAAGGWERSRGAELDSGRPGAGKTETVVSRVATGILSASSGAAGAWRRAGGTRKLAASPQVAAATTAVFATIVLMLPLRPAEITRMRHRHHEVRA